MVAEPFLFNLCTQLTLLRWLPFLTFSLATLYELRTATAAEKKRDLLVEVAKWSGDGLRVACLKMPSN